MQTETFPVNNFTELKEQLLTWANRFSSCSFLDNHQYQSAYHTQECLVAAGARYQYHLPLLGNIASVQNFIRRHSNEWIFGHFSYDLKNQLTGQAVSTQDPAGFSTVYLFVPEVVVSLGNDNIQISSYNAPPINVWKEIGNSVIETPTKKTEIQLNPAISREKYIKTVNRLREHILRGDCYEINFCQEFSSTGNIEPLDLYRNLSAESPNPFSCFYRNDKSFLLCASPERFIAKKAARIISQPIKGTSARNLNDPEKDLVQLSKLSESAKERIENVMIVDLVRNDLSRVCRAGSVIVNELFGIYSYPNVHQMVSTISGELKNEVAFLDILKACFPMGSMTGAPKKRVMELIDEYEISSRGIFSGAVGYLDPNGDFDFNVVIRSLLYNQSSGYISYRVGSGITWHSNAEEEYEECLLKALAIKKVLQAGASC